MSDSKDKKEYRNLLRVLSEINRESDLEKLLEDIFTLKEIRDAASRLEVARLLSSGVSYVEIEKQTGASATTIARVSKCLNGGSGGYEIALSLTD